MTFYISQNIIKVRFIIDKTGLLEYLNGVLGTNGKCIALSHARRFGKSHAAGMIDAYYSRGFDSSNLFDDTKIAESADYRKYMNKFNVIHLDISSVWDFHKADLVESVHQRVCDDFKKVSADTAIRQIKEKRYQGALSGYSDRILFAVIFDLQKTIKSGKIVINID